METRLVFQSHPTPEMLEEYSFGRLSPSDIEALEQHLLLCDACLKLVEETGQYIRLMKTELARSALSPLRNRLAIWGSAAGLAATVAVLFFSAPPRASLQPQTVTLVSFRGDAAWSAPRVHARQPLDLALEAVDRAEAPEYRVEVLSTEGEPAWTGVAKVRDGRLHASVPDTLARGTYWVRLYGPDSRQIYEYGLEVE